MKFYCPYCDEIGSLKKYPSDKVAGDGEVLIATCKVCKEEFSVAVSISQAPVDMKNMNLDELERNKDEALSKLMNFSVNRNK